MKDNQSTKHWEGSLASPAIAAHPDDPSILVAANDLCEAPRTQVHLSRDGGDTWTQLVELQDQYWSSLFFHRSSAAPPRAVTRTAFPSSRLRCCPARMGQAPDGLTNECVLWRGPPQGSPLPPRHKPRVRRGRDPPQRRQRRNMDGAGRLQVIERPVLMPKGCALGTIMPMPCSRLEGPSPDEPHPP